MQVYLILPFNQMCYKTLNTQISIIFKNNGENPGAQYRS